jgi:hypothetical protein
MWQITVKGSRTEVLFQQAGSNASLVEVKDSLMEKTLLYFGFYAITGIYVWLGEIN